MTWCSSGKIKISRLWQIITQLRQSITAKGETQRESSWQGSDISLFVRQLVEFELLEKRTLFIRVKRVLYFGDIFGAKSLKCFWTTAPSDQFQLNDPDRKNTTFFLIIFFLLLLSLLMLLFWCSAMANTAHLDSPVLLLLFQSKQKPVVTTKEDRGLFFFFLTELIQPTNIDTGTVAAIYINLYTKSKWTTSLIIWWLKMTPIVEWVIPNVWEIICCSPQDVRTWFQAR